MSAFTTGPWKAIDEDDRGVCFMVEGPTQTDGFTGGFRWFSEADARLIAAAPDLYASVRELRDALAGAMRVIHAAHLDDQFVAELRAVGVTDGLGVRAQALLDRIDGDSK